MFCEDFTNAKVFAQLEKRIAQEILSQSISDDISKDFRDIRDVTQALALLDVVIGYLVSVDGDREMLLVTYLRESLHMTKPISSEIVSKAYRVKGFLSMSTPDVHAFDISSD